MSYATITVEGGLLPPDLLDRIATDDNSMSGQKPADFGLSAGRRLPDEIQRTFSDARVHWDSFTRRLGTLAGKSNHFDSAGLGVKIFRAPFIPNVGIPENGH